MGGQGFVGLTEIAADFLQKHAVGIEEEKPLEFLDDPPVGFHVSFDFTRGEKYPGDALPVLHHHQFVENIGSEVGILIGGEKQPVIGFRLFPIVQPEVQIPYFQETERPQQRAWVLIGDFLVFCDGIGNQPLVFHSFRLHVGNPGRNPDFRLDALAARQGQHDEGQHDERQPQKTTDPRWG